MSAPNLNLSPKQGGRRTPRGKVVRRDDPELCLYRIRTEYLLRRYARMSVELGRLPSVLGREFFRTGVLSSHFSTFENVVIFVHDVESSLEKLGEFPQKVVARVALQEYTLEEAGALLGCGKATISRQYADALDDLSVIFLRGEMLEPFPETPVEVEEQSVGAGGKEREEREGGEGVVEEELIPD